MSSHQIYTGFWIDKTHSAILGATVTLPIRISNIIISVLTISVTISASCFWIIGAFIIHQVISHKPKVDVVGLQHQVILRNCESPLSSLWEVIKVQIAWKDTSVRGIRRRSLALAIPALFTWILFTIASVFVSEVASKSYTNIQVLLAPNNCGYGNFNTSTKAGLATMLLNNVRIYTETRAYANNYYSNSSSILGASSIFQADVLSYSTLLNTTCPFDDSLCLLGPSSGFSLETAPLDSHLMFGINAPKSDRVQYQKAVTCTVLDISGRNALVNNTYLRIYFGNTTIRNYTYEYNKGLASLGDDYTLQ
jgi:hypothetical protein